MKTEARSDMGWLRIMTGATKWHIERIARTLGIEFDDNRTVSESDGGRIIRYYWRLQAQSSPITDYSRSLMRVSKRAYFVQGGRPESKRR